MYNMDGLCDVKGCHRTTYIWANITGEGIKTKMMASICSVRLVSEGRQDYLSPQQGRKLRVVLVAGRLSHQSFAPHQENERQMYPESVEVNGIIFAQLYLALWIKTAHFLQQMGNFELTNCYPCRLNK